MKPDLILKSDLLDIIFEHKNKDYGAYDLRKNYNKRILQALGGTCLVVGLFVALQSMRPKDNGPGDLVYEGTIINLTPDNNKPVPEKEKPKPLEKAQAKPVKSVTNFVPVIKPDNVIPETTVNDNDEVDKNNIGDKPGDGENATPGNAIQTSGGTGSAPVTTGTPAPEETGVLDYADVMPSFNGDIVRYMLRNLRQPEDLEAGQKIVVRVKFVVTADGNIDDIQVVQSGREDLDEEVMRVVKRMPRWKPGMQAGRNVPVYFYLPVTFVSNAD